jgi:hypothetical protein
MRRLLRDARALHESGVRGLQVSCQISVVVKQQQLCSTQVGLLRYLCLQRLDSWLVSEISKE